MPNKNINLLPTDKPSKLFENVDNGLSLSDELEPNGIMCQNQNIYITNSEEIKEGDWFKHIFETIHKAGGTLTDEKEFKKIILTTDQDLIKDGVQSIDDEFLEWFVKNPSCEEVELIHQYVYSIGKWDRRYKIIIPKEEPYYKSVIEQAAKDFSLTKVDILELMRRAYNAGYNQYNIVEAGLEGKDTEENIRWILSKYQSEKLENSKRKRNFYCGDKVDYDEQCLNQCDRCVDATGVDYGYYDENQ